jgi:hypothetical protein
MENIYPQIRLRAQKIAAGFPPPDFYGDFAWANDLSWQCFETDFVIAELREYVSENLEDDFGHGVEHAVKVALDAGALMAIEGKQSGYTDDLLRRRITVVQCAGLLHDIRRKEKDHAVKGAEAAGEILKAYPQLTDAVADITGAISNHEAFKSQIELKTPEGALVSDCLYDADKFRWGPDNFTDTVWIMLSFSNRPLLKFIERYPRGIASLVKIKTTFRTPTGKIYGPRFIDLGLAIGDAVLEVIKTEFL